MPHPGMGPQFNVPSEGRRSELFWSFIWRSPIQFLTVHSHASLQLSQWNWPGRLATHPAIMGPLKKYVMLDGLEGIVCYDNSGVYGGHSSFAL